MTFSDGDIISTEEQTFSPFLSLADTVNGVSATYPNPAEGWNTKTAPVLLRPDLEMLDGNRRLLASVSLDMVPYGAQVQRLMKWSLGEALRARRHTLVLGPEYSVIEPGDVITWTSARNGYAAKLFRVDGVVYKSNLDVIVDLTRVKFAGPLKDMCRAIGLTERHIEGDLKEQPCDLLCGKSPRQFMQALGTQFGRDLIGPNLWVGLWAERVRQCLARGDRVVTDDCRFPNEAAAVRACGGRVVRLVGRGGIASAHASERLEFEPDAVINNTGSMDQLRARIMGRLETDLAVVA